MQGFGCKFYGMVPSVGHVSSDPKLEWILLNVGIQILVTKPKLLRLFLGSI